MDAVTHVPIPTNETVLDYGQSLHQSAGRFLEIVRHEVATKRLQRTGESQFSLPGVVTPFERASIVPNA